MAKIALVQMQVSDGEWQFNLERASEMIRGAAPADLYLLPELWTSGYSYDRWRQVASQTVGPVLQALKGLARERQATIAGSMITLAHRAGLANRLWCVSPDGVASYDKIHLFPPLHEPELLVAGSARCSVNVGGLILGLSLCYDLRFPLMYRRDAREGAHGFLVSAEWPKARADALRALCRARAIENQAFLVLCNRTGAAADGLAFGGGSAIFSPLGEPLSELGEEEEVAVAELDSSVVVNLRRTFPVFPSERDGIDA